jgi:hypothetical protein
MQEENLCCGLKVPAGSHILLLYKNESEMNEILSEFTKEGLFKDQVCALISSKKVFLKK